MNLVEIVKEALPQLDEIEREMARDAFVRAWLDLTQAAWHLRKGLPVETVQLIASRANEYMLAAQTIVAARKGPSEP